MSDEAMGGFRSEEEERAATEFKTSESGYEQAEEALIAEFLRVRDEFYKILKVKRNIDAPSNPVQEQKRQDLRLKYLELERQVKKLKPNILQRLQEEQMKRNMAPLSEEERQLIASKAANPDVINEVVAQVAQSHQKSGETTRSSGTEFASRFYSEQLENKKFLALLRGQPLTDLGGGLFAFSTLKLANAAESSHFNAVDVNSEVNYPDDSLSLEQDSLYRMYYTDFIPAERRQDYSFRKGIDMLHFLATLPDGYGNFTMNGIDSNVISNSEYLRYTLHHLDRCTPPGGVVFGANSPFLSGLLKYGFQEVTSEVLGYEQDSVGLRVYRKNT